MKDFTALPEKKIKKILETFLVSEGWTPEIAFDRANLIDIKARRGIDEWIIEVKGSESFKPSIVNSYLLVLGEILQRMSDEKCKYSVALPDTEPFRRLWERLPHLAKERTRITVLFVNPAGNVTESAE